MTERKYVIIGTDEVINIDWNQVLHNSSRYLRFNNAGTKCVINYEGSQPSFLTGKQEYTKEEIYVLTNSDINEWYILPSDIENGNWYDRIKNTAGRYNPFKNWL